ncbi:hypothetical protein [Leptothermofonsia sp. ETS-13]|uniref:hypothetical protein n=1 Tax=Leptothermofonsia sp. ETS-13 TaxID=3035696 RepID=UPI003BA0C647
MQQAIDRREFSLMLAGTLVAFSAAAMVGVYFLMGNYIGYVTGNSQHSISPLSSVEAGSWELPLNDPEEVEVLSILQASMSLKR